MDNTRARAQFNTGIDKIESEGKESLFMKRLHRNKYLLLMFMPGFIYFIVFKYLPMIGLVMAFQDFSLTKGIFGSEFAGFKHFVSLFTGTGFVNIFKNTLNISFLKIIFGFPMPIILALMFNEVENKTFKKITQTISYLPHFFSWVVLSGLIIFTFSPGNGIVNQVITMFGGKAIFFLADKK